LRSVAQGMIGRESADYPYVGERTAVNYAGSAVARLLAASRAQVALCRCAEALSDAGAGIKRVVAGGLAAGAGEVCETVRRGGNRERAGSSRDSAPAPRRRSRAGLRWGFRHCAGSPRLTVDAPHGWAQTQLHRTALGHGTIVAGSSLENQAPIIACRYRAGAFHYLGFPLGVVPVVVMLTWAPDSYPDIPLPRRRATRSTVRGGAEAE
jgi:hypothetical protein